MTEYTSENIFMQNSTSGGIQREHYIYWKKRKMFSTKYIASLAMLYEETLDLAENIFVKSAWSAPTGQRHRQSSGSLYHLSTLYPD